MYQAIQLGFEADNAIWNIPMAFILLMIRQKTFMESEKPSIQLSLMEQIDKGSI